MCMIYLHTTSYTARFTVLLVTAMRTKAKKNIFSLQQSFYFTLHNITLKKKKFTSNTGSNKKMRLRSILKKGKGVQRSNYQIHLRFFEIYSDFNNL